MNKLGLIFCGLITALILIFPQHFGLLGYYVKEYNPVALVLDYIDYEDCQTGRMHQEGVCEALRKKY